MASRLASSRLAPEIIRPEWGKSKSVVYDYGQ